MGISRRRDEPIAAAKLFNVGNEAIAFGADGLKITRRVRVIVQRLAQPGHGLGERRFTDHGVAPDGVHQFLPRNEPLTIGDQIDQQFQYDWFEMNLPPISGQSPGLWIDQEIIKAVHRMLSLNYLPTGLRIAVDARMRRVSSILRLRLGLVSYLSRIGHVPTRKPLYAICAGRQSQWVAARRH